MQQVGSSRDSSLPFSEGNEGPVANNHTVVGVEVPSSQALALTGSNPGRFFQRFPLPGTVLVTHPSRRVRRSLTLVQAPLGQDLDPHRNILIWPLHTMIGCMAPVLVRGGPIAPSQVVRRFQARTAYAQRADLIALPGTIDLRRQHRVLARNVALAARALTAREPMAPVLCTVIAVVLGGMVVQTTGLDEASAPVRAVAPLVGATDLNHKAGIGLDLIQDQTIPILCPENQGLGT